MPDIKTALSGILSEWELDNKQQEKQVQKAPYVPHFKVTNNVTRATFDFVKNNPHQSCKTICAALEKDGYRAFTSIPGLRLTTFSVPAYRALLLRGIAWAGRREQVAEFCTPDETAALQGRGTAR